MIYFHNWFLAIYLVISMLSQPLALSERQLYSNENNLKTTQCGFRITWCHFWVNYSFINLFINNPNLAKIGSKVYFKLLLYFAVQLPTVLLTDLVMATSAGDSSILEEELTCPVCLELYRDPHLLPCGHNFCLPCLRRLKSRSDHGRLRCPECRQSHRSSANWQKNFKLANIADGFRRRGQSERSAQSRSDPSHRPAEVRCDYCPGDGSEDGKGPMAVKTCLKCEVSMCPKHVQPHLELPAFREHPLVEPLNDMRKRKCLEHDEMFRYYCMDERLFLCNACTIEGTHNGHCIKTLKNTMKDFKVGLTFRPIQSSYISSHRRWYLVSVFHGLAT